MTEPPGFPPTAKTKTPSPLAILIAMFSLMLLPVMTARSSHGPSVFDAGDADLPFGRGALDEDSVPADV